ncbi:MAG TPA: tripartite tricarboxylate transporter substrate-binding protein [candidate division Zixibacteria bacterium]|nr:tripartite tricarboxylate transporter substrate-binding protein [candidate division Zixibacteria bacterium]
MDRKATRRWLAVVLLLALHGSAAAQDFYKGKTIRIVVGFSAGGGFDTYARAIARHMGKHIPGHPAVVVENMTGAGSLIAANHIFKVAKPDGLTIGHFIGGLFLGQVLGQKGIEFDARKFEFIGAPVTDHVVCALTKASGITSVEKWMASKTPIKMGGIAPGTSTPDNATRILKYALGLPIQLVSGYKGTADIRLAAEAGEIAGGCWGWDSVSVTWRKGLDSGEVVVVLQANRKTHPDLPKVPQAIKLAKTEEGRKLIEVGIHGDSEIVRTYTLPPGTPKDRVLLLRKAFEATLKDPEFVADAKKSKLNMDPVSAEDIEKDIAGLFKLDAATVAKLKEILYN